MAEGRSHLWLPVLLRAMGDCCKAIATPRRPVQISMAWRFISLRERTRYRHMERERVGRWGFFLCGVGLAGSRSRVAGYGKMTPAVRLSCRSLLKLAEVFSPAFDAMMWAAAGSAMT